MSEAKAIVRGAVAAAAMVTAGAATADRPAALETDNREYASFAVATAQSQIDAPGAIGGSRNTLDDAVMIRLGRTGRPARYDLELTRAGYAEGTMWTATAALDYLIPWGDLFSGYVGLVAGYARMEWADDDPLNAGRDFSQGGATDDGPVAGVRLGGLIEVTERVQVEIGYRYLHADLEADFRSGNARGTAEVGNFRLVHAGVNLRF